MSTIDELVGAVDFDEMVKEHQSLSKENTNNQVNKNKYVVLPKGEGYLTIRILPPAKGQKHFFQRTRIHKINDRNVHCSREYDPSSRRWVGRCPICEYYSSLYKQIDILKKAPTQQALDRIEELIIEARSIKPYERFYFNAIVRKMVDPDTKEVLINDGPRIYSCGVKQAQKIFVAFSGDERLDEKPLGDVTHIYEGRDFKIMHTLAIGNDGQQFMDYSQSKFLDPSPLGTEEEIVNWLSKRWDLSQERRVKNLEEMELEVAQHRGLVDNTTPESEPPVQNRQEVAATQESVESVDVPLNDDDFIRKMKAQISG